MSFLRVETTLQPSTAAGMVMGFGLMFYVLLAISAFTANLTTFLMMRRFATGVETVSDAVNFDFKICAYAPLGELVALRTPNLYKNLVNMSGLGQCAGLLFTGEVDAALVTETELVMAYSGESARRDCTGVEPGSTKKCPDGWEERDCEIEKIDEKSLMSINVAQPISHGLSQKMGWAFFDRMSNAILEGAKQNHSGLFPVELDDCRPPPVEPSAVPFNIKNLRGSTVASMVFVMIGWVLMSVGKIARYLKLKALERQRGHALTEEEIAAFDEEERRKEMLEGDPVTRLQVASEDCSAAVKTAQESRNAKLTEIEEQLSTVVGKLSGVPITNAPQSPSPTTPRPMETPMSMETPRSIPPEVADETNAAQRIAPYSTAASTSAFASIEEDMRRVANTLATTGSNNSLRPENQSLMLTEASKTQQQTLQRQWGQVEQELRQEQMVTEKLWREVASERQRLKEEWADIEVARSRHSERINSEHSSRLQTWSSTRARSASPSSTQAMASPREDYSAQQEARTARKAVRDQRQELQGRMNKQMEDSWADLHSQRASHREELRHLRELQAETSAMWRKVSKAQDETAHIRMLVPIDNGATSSV